MNGPNAAGQGMGIERGEFHFVLVKRLEGFQSEGSSRRVCLETGSGNAFRILELPLEIPAFDFG